MIKSAFTIMIPILFAALGGLMPALAGTLNIALEGFLLAGAFTSFTVYYYTGSIFLAITAAAVAAMILSALHAWGSFRLRANVYITGLAINLFSSGFCIILSEKIFKTKGVVTGSRDQGAGNSEYLLWYLFFAIILIILFWFVINKTPFGYRLRACEKSGEALISLGIEPEVYKKISFLVCGFICGIGGAFLSLNLGSYVPGMSAGKGWIALVIIYLGMQKPQGLLAAAFIYALAEAFSNYAQGFWQIPADFVLVFPFLFTLIAMFILSILKKNIKY